jgi:putative spermidine/putrescine transport system permease protein
MVHYMVPYAVLPLFANMRGIDKQLVTAARGLGAGSFESFWHVFFPLSLPGIIGAGVLVFILTLGFFVTPAILGGGKTVMIAEYVSVEILWVAHWGVGAMLAVVLLTAIALLLFMMARFLDVREMFGAR